MQHVQHRHRVRLGGVAADVQRSLRVLHVVVRIGHRAVAPGVGHAGHRGAVADARLVVGVVAAPQVIHLRSRYACSLLCFDEPTMKTESTPLCLAQLEHLGADLVERLVPADALVLAVDQLHRVLEAVLAVAVLAHRRALGAVRAQVDRAVEHRLLAHPDAVLDHRVDRAAHRAVAAHRALDFDLGVRVTAVLLDVGRLGLAHQQQLRRRHAGAQAEARAAQEGAAIERRNRARHAARQAVNQAR